MKTYPIPIFIFLFVAIICAFVGVVSANSVILEPGTQITTNNVNTYFANNTSLNTIVVGTDEIDFQSRQYNNLTMDPTSPTNVNIGFWTSTNKQFSITSGSDQINKYSLSGLPAGRAVKINDLSLIADSSGTVRFSSYSGTTAYTVISELVGGDDVYVTGYGETLPLSVEDIPGGIQSVVWTIDGKEVLGETGQEFDFVMSEPGLFNVTATIVANSGSVTTQKFSVRVLRQMATAHIQPINTTHYENTQKAIKNKDLTAFVAESNGAYTDLIGRMYFLIVFGIAFGFIWLQQRRMTIPTVLFLITGGIFAGFIPGEYLFYGMIFAGLAIAVSLYRIAEGYNQ